MKATEAEIRANAESDRRLTSLVAEFGASYRLTPRERDVLLLIFAGLKNTVIARRLGIADTTVRLHITGLHRKIGTGNKVDLIIELLKWHLGREPSGRPNDGRASDAAAGGAKAPLT